MQIHPVPNYGASLPGGIAGGQLVVAGQSMLPTGFVEVDAKGAVEFKYNDAETKPVRLLITKIKDALLELPDQIEMTTTHEFVKGLYIRRLFIPKGTLLVGKIHKQECINVVEQGDIAILTETGAMRVKAGFTIVSPAGIQKLGYANEDTVFTNIFRTDVTDIDQIEQELVWETHEQMERLLPDLVIEGA
jgi:hypothetical protein